MRLSVVIATKGRPETLRETLASIERCDPQPDELIVIDGDPGRSAEGIGGDRVRYVHSEPGLTHQRNVGVREASGDVVVFLDDDVEVDPGLFASLERAYDDPEVIGATGTVIEQEGDRAVGKDSPLRRLLLGNAAEGTMTAFGFPRRLLDQDVARDVEFMPGCLMSARRELVERVGFDEAMPGYGLAEDEDFSYRLSRLGRLRHVPEASLVHKATGVAGTGEREFNRMVVVNRAYLFRKNFDRSLPARAQFGLFVLGLAAHRALNREWSGVAGIGEGALQAWRERR